MRHRTEELRAAKANNKWFKVSQWQHRLFKLNLSQPLNLKLLLGEPLFKSLKREEA
jgi:hypothetical protein